MMPVLFIALAQACAPTIAPSTLAAIVSVESGMAPLAIRVNSTFPFKQQPASKTEAIETATALIMGGLDIDLGLGGISAFSLSRLGLSISDAFDPCLNLKAAATLLDEYRASAISNGSSAPDAETAMIQSYYGQGVASLGLMVGYDRRVRTEEQLLLPRVAELSLAGVASPVLPPREASEGAVVTLKANTGADNQEQGLNILEEPADKAPAPAWDIFNTRPASTVLVFPNQRQE